MNTTFALLTFLIQIFFCHQSHSTTYQKKRKKLTIGYLNFCTDFVGTKVINFTLIWKCRLPKNGTFIGPRKGYLQRILSFPALASNIETLYQMLFSTVDKINRQTIQATLRPSLSVYASLNIKMQRKIKYR